MMEIQKFELPITTRVLIKKSPEEVYPLISSSQGWDSWFTAGSLFELGSADSVMKWVNAGPDKISTSIKVKVTKLEWPKLVEFEWNFGMEGGPTTVRLEVEPHAEGCVVKVFDGFYPDTKEGRACLMECATGWGDALVFLKFFAEQGYRS